MGRRSVGRDFAHEVEFGERAIALLAGELREVERNFGDQADQPRVAGVDHHELGNRGARVIGAERKKTDLRLGAAYADDAADRLALSELPARRRVRLFQSHPSPPPRLFEAKLFL